MKRKKCINLLLALILTLGMTVNGYSATENNNTVIDNSDVATSQSALNAPLNNNNDITTEPIELSFHVSEQWQNGFNGEIRIKNTGDTVIENWQVSFDFPQEITNIWNAEIVSHENHNYVIKNSAWNCNIPVQGEISFGISGTYDNEITAPDNCKLLSGIDTAAENDYNIEYSLLSDWDTGYTAQITITNNTDTDIVGWHLEFDYKRQIYSIWNGIIDEQTNNHLPYPMPCITVL